MNIYVALIVAAGLSFLIAFSLGFVLIPWLRKVKFGQTIKEIGPTWHQSKQGTPTMGGIIIILLYVIILARAGKIARRCAPNEATESILVIGIS